MAPRSALRPPPTVAEEKEPGSNSPRSPKMAGATTLAMWTPLTCHQGNATTKHGKDLGKNAGKVRKNRGNQDGKSWFFCGSRKSEGISVFRRVLIHQKLGIYWVDLMIWVLRHPTHTAPARCRGQDWVGSELDLSRWNPPWHIKFIPSHLCLVIVENPWTPPGPEEASFTAKLGQDSSRKYVVSNIFEKRVQSFLRPPFLGEKVSHHLSWFSNRSWT
jgi:hypothetical protein